MLAFKDKANGKEVVLLGNGPSLREQDPAILRGRGCIATNSGWKWSGSHPDWTVSILTDTDKYLSLADELETVTHPVMVGIPFLTLRAWRGASKNCSPIFLPSELRPDRSCELTPYGEELGYFLLRRKAPQWDLPKALNFTGDSVIFAAMQLGVFMGATRLILLGVDMDYSGPSTHFKDGIVHLNPDYDYEKRAKASMIACRETLAARGVELVNATLGGRVNELARVSL